jgi:hypothetical protein
MLTARLALLRTTNGTEFLKRSSTADETLVICKFKKVVKVLVERPVFALPQRSVDKG